VRPFEGASYSVILNSILTAEPKPLNEVNPLVPADAAAMVRKMIQKEPADRFQTSALLRTELENLIEAMGLQRHREMLRQFARDPKAIGDILREKRMTRHFEEGVRLEGQGPEAGGAAQLEFRRVLYLDPNHRAALDHLKKLDREAAKTEAASGQVASAAAPAAPAAASAPAPAPAPAKPVAGAPAPAPKPQAKAPVKPAPKPAAAAPKPPKPAKPAGAKTALPMPLILVGVIGVLVVLLVVRLIMGRSAGTGSPAQVTAPPVASVPDVQPSAPPEPQAATPVPSPVPSPVPPPAQAPPPSAQKPAPTATTAPVATEPPAARPAGATAMLRISTEPAGASVTIDGVRQSRATNAVYPVTPGSHSLVIEKPGFYPQDMTVSDLKKDETRPAGLSLKAMPPPSATGGEGTIAIHVTPPSKIFVNDVMVRSDATDATLKFPAGAYTIKVVNATFGSQEWRRDLTRDAPVKIDYDFEAAARAAAEAPTLGKLRVSAQGPAGAQVWVDGVNTGLVAPCLVEQLKAGPHTVNLVLDGYVPERANQSVTIKPGATADIKFKLKKHK
jgi:hypothetical protein